METIETLNVTIRVTAITIRMTIRELFLKTLYDLSERELRTIDRYDVGKELNLPKNETDAIVDELSDRGRIRKTAGSSKIMLSLNEKKILDSEWRQAND